jgi:hypothetical protein
MIVALTEHMKTILTALLADVSRLEAVPDILPSRMDREQGSALRRDQEDYHRFGIRHDLAGWLGHAPTRSESAVFSRTLQNMETMGLLVRVNRWGGRRSTHVRLTTLGRAEAERVAQKHEAALDRLMAGVVWHLEDGIAAVGEPRNGAVSGLDSLAPLR